MTEAYLDSLASLPFSSSKQSLPCIASWTGARHLLCKLFGIVLRLQTPDRQGDSSSNSSFEKETYNSGHKDKATMHNESP